jgi:hypothetical protein
MRNILLALLLANILYYLWGQFVDEPKVTGIVVVNEADLGPPLAVEDASNVQAATSVGAVLGSGKPSDLAAVVGRACVSIGPFTKGEAAGEALAEYEAEGVWASRRETQGQIIVGYWVQIRDIPDRASGNAMVETLRKGGLGEAYVVDTEDEGLKISLGVFGEMSRAERVELQAKSLDLPADITPRTRDAMVFFVDIGLPQGKGAASIVAKYGEDRVLLRNQATCPQSD